MDFPSSYFYIKSQYTGRVLQPVNSEAGSSVGVFEQKHPGTDGIDSQLWTWVEGFLINKETGLALDVPKGIQKFALLDTHVKMEHRADAAPLQLWDYVRGGWIATRSKGEQMVIDIRHESKKDGAHVHLYHLKTDEGDNANQKWMFDLPIALKKNKTEADLKQAHDQVQGNKVHLSHEILASAAAFTAMKAWEDKQRAEGLPVHHALAKEVLAAAAGAEAVRLWEERGGTDTNQREEIKQSAIHQALSAWEQKRD